MSRTAHPFTARLRAPFGVGLLLAALALGVGDATAGAVESRYQIYLGYGAQSFDPGTLDAGDLQSVQITYRALAPTGPNDRLWSFEYGAELFRSGDTRPAIDEDGTTVRTRGRFFFYRVARFFGSTERYYAGLRLGYYYLSRSSGGNIQDVGVGLHAGRRFGAYDVALEVLAPSPGSEDGVLSPGEFRLTLGFGF